MLTIFESIKKEFQVNDKGESFCSRRAIARMTGKHRKTIQNLLDSIGGGKIPHKMFKPFAGVTFNSGDYIPDTLASLIIQYYAFIIEELSLNCSGSYCDVNKPFSLLEVLIDKGFIVVVKSKIEVQDILASLIIEFYANVKKVTQAKETN